MVTLVWSYETTFRPRSQDLQIGCQRFNLMTSNTLFFFNQSSNSSRSQTQGGRVTPTPLCREGWRNGEYRRGLKPNSDEVCKSRRWSDFTYAVLSPVSFPRKPLSPVPEAAPKNGLISFALARSSPNMASYWFIFLKPILSVS